MSVLLVEMKWYRGASLAVHIPAKRLLRLAFCAQPAKCPPDGITCLIPSNPSAIRVRTSPPMPSSRPKTAAAWSAWRPPLSSRPPTRAAQKQTARERLPHPRWPRWFARFSPPTGAHPPVEPSFSKAAGHCAWELANAALDIGEVAKAGGDWISKAFAVGHALVNVGNAARCIQRDEAQQVAEGERLNQSADCVRDGAVPLLEPDGSVVCAAQ